MNKMLVSPSPHIHSGNSTWRIMLDVIIALVPVTVASCIIFGMRTLLVVAVAVAASVLSEFLFELICKKPVTVGDLSSVVTGMILALCAPVTVPLWQVAIGSVFAIVVVKMLFGGIGKNFANPAATARIFMFISFGTAMAPWKSDGVDIFSSATPLALPTDSQPPIKDMLLGTHSGCMGETCIVALLLGLAYLLIRKVITWHIPVAYIGSVFVITGIMYLFGMDINPVYQILSGALVFGAVFMATDYSTSPHTSWGKIVFGVGAGIITVIIRVYANYPEGVSFALLLMNILTPYIDKWTRRKPLGGAKA